MMKTNLLALPDSELQVRVKNKDSQAFEILFDRYWKHLYSFAMRIYKDEDVCQDIVQEIFISFWEKHAQETILNLEAYLLRAVKYRVANHIRDLKFDSTHLQILESIPYPFETDKDLIYQDFEDTILSEIEKLPPKCRNVFMMSRFEAFSNSDIAKKLNISERTVEKHISDAVKFLKLNINTTQITVLVTGMFFHC